MTRRRGYSDVRLVGQVTHLPHPDCWLPVYSEEGRQVGQVAVVSLTDDGRVEAEGEVLTRYVQGYRAEFEVRKVGGHNLECVVLVREAR